MKLKHVKKSAAIFLAGFLLLFSARAIYTFKTPEGQGVAVYGQSLSNFAANVEVKKLKNNYASSKTVVVAGETAKSVSVDQKYERVGFVNSESNNFEEDSNQIRSIIKEHKAVVQFEDNTGIKGDRTLELSMGVHPDKFDEFVEELKKVGKLTYFKVQKTDKTSEYKDLKAKLATTEKYRDALVKLKAKGGNISDLTALENKILEVEEKIQSFGVQLGDFSQENELCTVKMSFRENLGIAKKSGLSLFFVIKTLMFAFVWSLGYYFLFLLTLLLGGVCGHVLLGVYSKGRKMYEDYKGKSHEDMKA